MRYDLQWASKMSSGRISIARGALAVVVMALAACRSGGPDVAPSGLLAAPEAVTSPTSRSEAEMVERAAAITAALEGLVVDGDGRLRPAEPTGRRDADAASRYRRLALEPSGDDGLVEAIGFYAKALLADPHEAQTHADLGRLLRIAGRVDGAKAARRRALDLDPALTEVRFELASDLFAEGDVAAARAQAERLLEGRPDHGDGHALLAMLLHAEGDDAGALFHVEEAERLGGMIPGTLGDRLRRGAPRRARTFDLELPTSGNTRAVGGQTQIDTSGTGRVEETSASASDCAPGGTGDCDPDRIVAAWHDYGISGAIRIATAATDDGGATWTRSFLNPSPGSIQEGDPMTATDPLSGSQWIGGIGFDVSGTDDVLFVARRNPGTTAFATPTVLSTDLDLDKPWMAAGPRYMEPASTRVYVGVSSNPWSRLWVSDDLDDVWISLWPAGQVGIRQGILPRVGPDGELLLSALTPTDSSRVEFARSFDNGATLDTIHFIQNWDRVVFRDDVRDPTTLDHGMTPGGFRIPPFPNLAIDPNDGTAYLLYFDCSNCDPMPPVGVDRDLDLYLLRSTNQGDSWVGPALALDEAPGEVGDQFFSWLEVDDQGRLHVVYYDSRNTMQSDTDEDGYFDVYYAVSADAGDIWFRFRLTPSSFLIDDGIEQPTGQMNRFLGDYIGMAVAGGIANPVYVTTQNGDLDVFTNRIELNDPPTAVDDFFATPAGEPLVFLGDDLLVNDGNDPGAAVVCAIGTPASGTLTEVDGVYTYQPNLGGGDETIAYTVCGPAGQASADLHIDAVPWALHERDDFEDGLDPVWTPRFSGNGKVGASSAAAIHGSLGLETAVAGAGDIAYVEADLVTAGNIEVHFHLDPTTMDVALGKEHVLLEGWRNGVGNVFLLQVGRNGAGQYRIRGRLRSSPSAFVDTDWYPLDGPSAIHLDWNGADLPFPEAVLALYVDGQVVPPGVSLTSTYGPQINRIHLGAVRGVDAGTSGHASIDSVLLAWLLLR